MATSLIDVTTPTAASAEPRPSNPVPETWAASRALEREEEKELMARHFADHDFLVRAEQDPATAPRWKPRDRKSVV